jgi:hypothetical protein
MMKASHLYFYIVFLFFLTSCSSDENDEAPSQGLQELQNNGGTISATVIDSVGFQSDWTTDLVRIERYEGWMRLKTNNYETGEKLTIELENDNPGSYFRNFGEGGSLRALFEPSRDQPLSFASIEQFLQTSTEFTIAYDTLNNTASGSFDIYFTQSNDNPRWKLSSGIFENVPYNSTLLGVNGTFNAEINGVPMDLNFNAGFIDHTNDRIDLSFNDLDNEEAVGIRIPSDFSAGTYTEGAGGLPWNGLQYQSFSGMNPGPSISENPVLTILYHDRVNRTIAGQFSLDVPEDETGPFREIRNGFFECQYNDWQ